MNDEDLEAELPLSTSDSDLQAEDRRMIDDKKGHDDKSGYDDKSEQDDAAVNLEELLQGLGLGVGQYITWGILFLTALSHKLTMYFMTSVLNPYLRCEWKQDSALGTSMGTTNPIVIALSGVLFGSLADKYGRRTVLLATSILLLIGSLMAAFSPNYWVFLAARVMQGLCTGIGFPVTFIFATEVVNAKFKELAVFTMAMSAQLQQLGGIFLSLITRLFLNQNLTDWRTLTVILISPLVCSILGLFCIPESPRYLLVSGKGEEALSALQKLFKWNGTAFPDIGGGVKVMPCQVEECEEITGLFRHGLAKLTTLLTVVFFSNLFMWAALAAYLTLYSQDTGQVESTSSSYDKKCTQTLDQKVLNGYLAAFLGDVVGCSFAAFAGKRVGRRLVIRGFAVLAIVISVPVYFDITSDILKDVSSMLFRFSVTGLRFTLWLIAIEAYPTVLKGTVSGFTHAFGEAGGAIGAVLTYELYPVSSISVVALFVSIAVVQLVASFLWGTEIDQSNCDDDDDETDGLGSGVPGSPSR
ncbi:hypothetical protein ACHWQZ_G015901 [Mnemiopsis leidyi]